TAAHGEVEPHDDPGTPAQVLVFLHRSCRGHPILATVLTGAVAHAGQTGVGARAAAHRFALPADELAPAPAGGRPGDARGPGDALEVVLAVGRGGDGDGLPDGNLFGRDRDVGPTAIYQTVGGLVAV